MTFKLVEPGLLPEQGRRRVNAALEQLVVGYGSTLPVEPERFDGMLFVHSGVLKQYRDVGGWVTL